MEHFRNTLFKAKYVLIFLQIKVMIHLIDMELISLIYPNEGFGPHIIPTRQG